MIDVELDNYINKMKRRLFRWGKVDCALFAADWCEIKCGVNPAEGSHGKYSTKEGADKHLKEKYGCLEKAFSKHFMKIKPSFGQKGDVCLCHLDHGETVGIIGGRGFVFFKSLEKGIIAKRNPEILFCWRVE